jgi:activator of 2-hydroxyglutaryl-CoA dehydratase
VIWDAMLVTGIDIGSMSTKIVILNDNHLFNAIFSTGWSSRRLEQIDYQIAVDCLASCQANFVVDIGCTGQ